MAFTTPVDICNRALQILGARRISSLTDGSREASEVAFAYSTLRQFELRRNAWRFAIRRAALRPMDDDSKSITPAAYDATRTYSLGYLATYGGATWQSQVASNLAHTPGADDNWEIWFGSPVVVLFDTTETTSYFSGETVYVTTPAYTALTSSLEATPPTSAWAAQTSATLAGLANTILQPLASGPDGNGAPRSVYPLPNGYLRMAPQNPKGDMVSFLGGPSNNFAPDWVVEGKYIITTDINPIIIRFVGDVQRVSSMDPMFCEGLAGRIAFATCETITQSRTKLTAAKDAYLLAMVQARLENAIEVGSDAQPEDDWITVRA